MRELTIDRISGMRREFWAPSGCSGGMHDSMNWAHGTFGGAELGDARRVARLVRMAGRTARHPAGTVTEVFGRGAERQAAYDLLENEAVRPKDLTAALSRSTLQACAEHERVLVVLDGTSLTVTDRQHAKGLGRLGTFKTNGSGLKLINAIALTTAGEPIGVADQQWWVREHEHRAPRGKYRGTDTRESIHWREAVGNVDEVASKLAPDATLHFLADREGDASLLIWQLIEQRHEFTIRSNSNRKVLGRRGAARLRPVLAQRHPIAIMEVALPASPRRMARTARLVIRAAKLDVRMRDHHRQELRIESLTFVWAREERSHGAIDWMLVTNTDVTTAHEACEAVRRYTKRWRIEDFHRTWKSGVCGVEDTQLRSADAIVKWATILAAVAARVEALRHHAREQPDAPATTVLSSDEIDALVLLKSDIKSRKETITAEGLTIQQAVRWIADIGGYTGNHNNGKPGAITIGRGLTQLIPAATAIAALRASGKLR
jgi:hypothetical protein